MARDAGTEKAPDHSGRRKKPLSFYMAFLCLLIMVFVCSADSTIMSVSIPVSTPTMSTPTSSQSQKLISTDNHQRAGRHYL